MAILGVDLDHTLVNFDKPIPYAREAINLLREQGHYILIHTCNSVKWAEKVLNNLDIRYDSIWGQAPGYEGNKPACSLYIDDRGLYFKGDWKETLKEVEARLTEDKKGIGFYE